MRTLYHYWLSPFSRKVRIVLHEKKLDFGMIVEPVWERRQDFLALNPAGEVPVLIEPNGAVIADHYAICEYLDEFEPEPTLLGRTLAARAEVRRLVNWFDVKFNQEVTMNLVFERMLKRQFGFSGPDSRAIRAGCQNIHIHMEYIAWLTERRKWLAGDQFSLADIAAAAHISCVDYINDVPWDQHPGAKDWYARIKSRPSFRPLLADRLPGSRPPKHYDDLDF